MGSDYGASSAASNAGTAAESIYSAAPATMEGAMDASAATAGGYSLGAGGDGAIQSVGNGVAPNQGWFGDTMDYLGKMNEGKDMNLLKDWRKFGFNPETYGYVTSKLGGQVMKGGGGAPQAGGITINSSYTAPNNDSYLQRYRRR